MDDDQVSRLIGQAVSGNEEAMMRLLWSQYYALVGHVRQRLPRDLPLTVEDVVQESLVSAWQSIAGVEARTAQAFSGWLQTIADRRLADAIRRERAVKRGGRATRLEHPTLASSSVVPLCEALSADSQTPSRSAVRHEAELAVRLALSRLREQNPDQWEVLTLRYLQDLSFAEIGNRMDRSEAATQMLCNRAIKSLRELMGRASRFFDNP